MSRRTATARLTGAAVVLLLAITVLVALRVDALVDVDAAIADRAFTATVGRPWAVAFWEHVATWGQPMVLRALVLLVAAALLLARRPALAAWAALVTLAEAVLAPASKLLLDRPRPAWPDPIQTLGSPSYPSGHATAAGLLATVVVLVASVLVRDVRVRRALVTLCLAGCLLVSAGRLFLGVHYLSDVVAGLLLGAVIALVPLLVVGGRLEASGRDRARSRTGSARSGSSGDQPWLSDASW